MILRRAKRVYILLVMISSGYFTYKVIDKKAEIMLTDLGELNTKNVLSASMIGAGEAGISIAAGILTSIIVNTIL